MHKHWPKGHPYYDRAPWCPFRTVKECDEAYAQWQAERQVELAASIVAQDKVARYRKDAGVFAQLVQLLAGERTTIVNEQGVESKTPFTRRLLEAARRYSADGMGFSRSA